MPFALISEQGQGMHMNRTKTSNMPSNIANEPHTVILYYCKSVTLNHEHNGNSYENAELKWICKQHNLSQKFLWFQLQSGEKEEMEEILFFISCHSG